MDKWRRHVFLAVNNFGRGTYPLRRIDASSLFYPRNQTKPATTAMPPADEAPLPRPCISFSPAPLRIGKGSDLFGFFGLGRRKTLLVAVNYRGVSLTYDVDDDCIVSEIGSPQQPKIFEPVSVALGDALYVMDRTLVAARLRCFEALTFGPPKECRSGTSRWQWSTLQPPPFMFDPGYKTTPVGAYTVDGGSTSILISMPNIGTYSFDTVSSSWDKVGDWELPFHGRADFFPEYGAWLGFSAQDGRLCYSPDLGASMQCRPVLDVVWDHPDSQLPLDDPDPKCCTRVLKSQLVHLGCGKFCVAKFMETVEDELTEHGIIPQAESFAVLTGLVLKPTEFDRGIDMIPHKSVQVGGNIKLLGILRVSPSKYPIRSLRMKLYHFNYRNGS